MEIFSSEERRKTLQILDAKEMHGAPSSNHKSQYIDINSFNLSVENPIYRIMSLPRLYSILEKKQNSLVKPHKWDDPFENFLLNSEGILEDGTRVSFDSIRDSFYAQCWSLKKECDGLWRNYKNGKDIVIKIKTTVKNIMSYFYDLSNQFHSLSYFIGKVDYVSDEEIVDFFKNSISLRNFNEVGFVNTLLIKRKAFSYEEEVRIIFSRPNSDEIDLTKIVNPWDDTDFFSFSVDPNVFIEEIEIDPWVTPKEYDKLKNDILLRGYTGKIIRSSLYENPFFRIKIE